MLTESRVDSASQSQAFQSQSRLLQYYPSKWLNPAALLLIVPGMTGLVACLLPSAAYRVWGVDKFLDGKWASLLALGLTSTAVGALAAIYLKPRVASIVRVELSPEVLHFLLRTYRIFLALTLLGYTFWIASGASQGVGVEQLRDVLTQEAGAVSDLKSNARPISGVTTLTQFGPMAVLLGSLLRREGFASRYYLIIVFLGLFRAMFYAERLALIEVLLPLVFLAVFRSAATRGFRAALVRLTPVYSVPLVWVMFAAFEYFRSWTVLKDTTDQSFFGFISLRLAGYYVTSYNNSALFASQLEVIPSLGFPYQSFPFVWNAPVLGSALGSPSYLGLSSEDWVKSVLELYANPEFTNRGSFLITFAELGGPGMVAWWLIVGLGVGGLYSLACRGSLGGLLAYCVVAVGILELPRIIYWTEGRSIPVLLSIVWVFVGLNFLKRRATVGDESRRRSRVSSFKL